MSSRPQGGGSPWSKQVAPASCLSRGKRGRPGQDSECLPAGCRRYPGTEQDGQAHPLQGREPRIRGHGPLLLSLLFPLHTDTGLVCLLFPLLTQNQGGAPSPENVGAPTFSIFPLIFCTFLLIPTCTPRKAAATQLKRARQASPLQKIRNTDRRSRATPHSSPVAGYWLLNGVESGGETRSHL